MNSRAAVFLDRDGTLMTDVAYCADPQKVAVFADAASALKSLKDRGYLLILVTNQSGIGRGYFTEADFQSVQAEFFRQLGTGLIDAAYHCPDAPDQATSRRKPGPGMLLEAAAEHGICLAKSYLIGDSDADTGCARAAGLAGVVRLGNRERRLKADAHAENLTAAAAWILAHG
jgi:histidinol-phosphate phosphatase family protein